MKTVLREMSGTNRFVDNIAVWGATREENDTRLQEILSPKWPTFEFFQIRFSSNRANSLATRAYTMRYQSGRG